LHRSEPAEYLLGERKYASNKPDEQQHAGERTPVILSIIAATATSSMFADALKPSFRGQSPICSGLEQGEFLAFMFVLAIVIELVERRLQMKSRVLALSATTVAEVHWVVIITSAIVMMMIA
jgi:hypothetical protein